MSDLPWQKNYLIPAQHFGFLIHELYQYKAFCNKSLELWEYSKKELHLRVEEDIKNLEENGVSDWDFSEEFHDLETIFPNIQIESAFLIGYATFESVLKRICLSAKYHYSLNQNVGQYLEGYQKFLNLINEDKAKKKVTNAFLSEEYKLIDVFRKVRNCIVHSSGDLSHENENKVSELKQIANDYDFMEISNKYNPSEYERITISPNILQLSSHTYEQFLYKLCTRD